VRFVLYIGIIVVAAAGTGAWLRWAATPVFLAAAVGMRLERIRQLERSTGE
jgi:hypothetical protein